MGKVCVDRGEANGAAAINDEGSWHGQFPRIIAVIFGEIKVVLLIKGQQLIGKPTGTGAS